MKSVSCLAIVFVLFALSKADYCTLESCTKHGHVHTVCKFPDATPGPACGKEIQSIGVTPAEKIAIVRQHNALRRYVAKGLERRGLTGPQPAATNMQRITWDDELASIAQRWANQCSFGHDQCRNVERYSVGQNVGIRSTTGVNNYNATSVIRAWYDEVAKFDSSQVKKLVKPISGTGHYTQIVWANTTKIGCGQIKYKEDDEWNAYYLVCNYGPAGNVKTLPIYLTP